MFYRWYDCSYAQGGQYHTDATYQSAGDGSHLWACGMESLLLVNGLAVAFLSHYNGCKYYREYIDHRPDRFGRIVSFAFFLVSMMFFFAMVFGYATFGHYCQGTVLNNYAEDDFVADIARVGMGLANVFSFPLMFSGLREAVLALIVWLAPWMEDVTAYISFQNSLSALLLAAITFMAVIVTDASLVVGLVGSICGSATIYVIPCFLYAKACAHAQLQRNAAEIVVVRMIGFLGICQMLAGAWATLAF